MEIENKLYEIYADPELLEIERNNKLFSELYHLFLNKRTGSFFTSPDIAKKITELSFEGVIIQLDKLKVLDPACGVGEFLIAAANQIFNTIMSEKNASTEEKIELREKIVSNCLFGYDIDSNTIKICRLRLQLWTLLPLFSTQSISFSEINSQIEKFHCNIIQIDFFDLTDTNEKYDLVLCNPPYNAEIYEKQQKRMKNMFPAIIRNSAAYFYLNCESLVIPGGKLGFVMPKSLVYSKRWRTLKTRILHNLDFIQDISKAFKQVKLEEVILISSKNSTNQFYVTQFENQQQIKVEKSDSLEHKSLILNLSSTEYKLFEQLRQFPHKLGNFISSHRGLNIQSKAVPFSKKSKNPIYCIEGSQIKQFHLLPVKRIIYNPRNKVKVEKFERGTIIGQLANAHVKNPKPHYKLAFCFTPKSTDFISFDTVINISAIQNQVSHHLFDSYLLCYLNSNLFAWYLYKIVYAGAIRSTRLDFEYLKQVPFIPIDTNQKELPIFWYFFSQILTFLSYLQLYFSKTSQKLSEINNQLNEIMNTAIYLHYLSKSTLTKWIESINIDWDDLEIFSREIRSITQSEVIFMITDQDSSLNGNLDKILKKIVEYASAIRKSKIILIQNQIEKSDEWQLIM